MCKVRSSNSSSKSNVEFVTPPWFRVMAQCGCVETINRRKSRKLTKNILLRKRRKKLKEVKAKKVRMMTTKNLERRVKNQIKIRSKRSKMRMKNLTVRKEAKKLDKV